MTFDVTFSNLLIHTDIMLKNAKLHKGSAFESLREYEPFFKYISSDDVKFDLFLKNQIIKNSLIVRFPIIGIKRKKFLQERSVTLRAYLKIREKLKKLGYIGWNLENISKNTI